jgi:preprotein translocase subunit Sec63
VHDRHNILQELYHSLKRDHAFCFVFVLALLLTLVWCYLERFKCAVVNNDPYEILGLIPPVSIKEIKEAYRSKHFDWA